MTRLLSTKYYLWTEAMKRRLQTLAVMAQIVTMLVCTALAYIVLPYIICFTRFSWAGLAYLCYMLVDRKIVSRGGRPSDWVRRWTWWTYFRDYFPLKLVKTAELDPSRNYLLCAFPHGILSSGTSANFATEANNVSELFPGITHHVTTLDVNIYAPFVRELIMRMGICSCSRESLDYLLDSSRGTGRSAVLIVGGAAEALISKPGAPRVLLKKRKGFVKIALKNGASLVPVFSFGENDLYYQVNYPEGSWVRWGQEVIRRVTHISPVLICGQGLFENSYGLIPLRRPITTIDASSGTSRRRGSPSPDCPTTMTTTTTIAMTKTTTLDLPSPPACGWICPARVYVGSSHIPLVGNPMAAEYIPEPTQEQIDDLHSRFTEQLVALFEEHKHHYLENPEKTYLIID